MNVEGDAPLSPARHVTASHRMKLLPVDFVPTIDDVICGRGKKCYSHVGNDRFRERVHTMLALYKQARSKLDKSKVLNMVVEQVRQNSPGGGFVKQDESGRWYEVGDFLAREKTSQTFRDALHESYKSSSVAKKKRRQQEVTRSSTGDQINKVPRSSIDIAQKIKSMSLEMKNSAKNQVYTQSQTNADIMAGIQQASRDLRRDMMETFQQQHHHQQQQQGFGGFGNSAPQVPFQLEFEPEDGMGMAGGHHPGLPARSQSFQNPGARGMRGTGGVGRSLSGNLEMYNNSFPTHSATLPPPQAFMSASMGDMQFRMGQSSSSAGDFSMADDEESNMAHSVPSINFDAEDLHIDEKEQRMHRSAPNLGFYSPSDLMGGPVNVPSSIEFQMGQRQQPAFGQNQPRNQMPPAVGGIVSQLETLAQLRMEDDDNPFEPLPIDQQQQNERQEQHNLPQQPPFPG